VNLPLCGIALALTVFFFKIKAPETTMQEKLDQMDYWNVLFVAAATSTVLGLTWGGGEHPWSSYQVLVPLIVGIVGMVAFVVIERKYVKHPTVPFDILVHRNALLGYLTTYLHAVVMLAVVFYYPLYFQVSTSLCTSPASSGGQELTPELSLADARLLGRPVGRQDLLNQLDHCAVRHHHGRHRHGHRALRRAQLARLGARHHRLRPHEPSQVQLADVDVGRLVSTSSTSQSIRQRWRESLGDALGDGEGGALLERKESRSPFPLARSPVIVGIGLGLLYTGTMFPVLAPLQPAQQPYAVRPPPRGPGGSSGTLILVSLPDHLLRLRALLRPGPRHHDRLDRLLEQVRRQAARGVRLAVRQRGLGRCGLRARSADCSAVRPLYLSRSCSCGSGTSLMRPSRSAEPIRSGVREAYAETLVVLWQILIGLGGLGFLISLGLKNIALTTEVEESWGVQEKKKEGGAHGLEEESVGR